MNDELEEKLPEISDLPLNEAVQKWIGQGRTRGQIDGVLNFLTGAGMIAIKELVKQARQEAVERVKQRYLASIDVPQVPGSASAELRRRITKLPMADPALDAIDAELARLIKERERSNEEKKI